MSDEDITLRYEFDGALMQQAIVAWKSAGSKRKSPIRSFAMGGAIGLVLVAGMVVLLEFFPKSGLKIEHFSGALVGASLVFLYWQWQHMRTVKQVLAITFKSETARGEMTCIIGASGLNFRSSFGDSLLKWVAIDVVYALKGGTGLRIGGQTIPLPDAALPEGMKAAEFRAQIEKWRVAA